MGPRKCLRIEGPRHLLSRRWEHSNKKSNLTNWLCKCIVHLLLASSSMHLPCSRPQRPSDTPSRRPPSHQGGTSSETHPHTAPGATVRGAGLYSASSLPSGLSPASIGRHPQNICYSPPRSVYSSTHRDPYDLCVRKRRCNAVCTVSGLWKSGCRGRYGR